MYALDEPGKEPQVMKGSDLAKWTMTFEKPRSTRWVFYRKVK